jgi:hypothetical protein
MKNSAQSLGEAERGAGDGLGGFRSPNVPPSAAGALSDSHRAKSMPDMTQIEAVSLHNVGCAFLILQGTSPTAVSALHNITYSASVSGAGGAVSARASQR